MGEGLMSTLTGPVRYLRSELETWLGLGLRVRVRARARARA